MDQWTTFETELGWIALAWSPHGLRMLRFTGPERPLVEASQPPGWVMESISALSRFLAGESAAFQNIPLDLSGLTPFTQRVLEVLRHTRPGEILTYGHLARLAGSPGASRAVGQVMAKNPLPILIPCHRVVAANGPGGFSLFGSLETKERLMAIESGRRPLVEY
ncbi:MAG: methylated-DNA--[protein]-cysteine S-methyltransferase, partial [Holophaga sp.]|nr:methylated-DNA--[protein]-cysteine S-methyltransferase [Holophaga sp.]